MIKRVLNSGKRFYSSYLRLIKDEKYEQPKPKKDDNIIIAMSSGVDSSVAAAIFSREYKNVKGIFMANWSSDAKCTEADWKDVQKVCNHINIPCERVNFEKEYWIDVFEPMIASYRKGLTPNPDVNCNRYVKFGKMIEHLNKKLGETNDNWWLVTGHYSRIVKDKFSGEYELLRSEYLPKDQSFYLSTLPRDSLKRLILPLGYYTKPDVRKLAHQFELPTSEKPDSQGLCFVSQTGHFRDFLNEYIKARPGNIVTEDGKIWGKHNGLWHATIGQRSGVSMPQGDPNYQGVWFVSDKLIDSNEIVIVKGSKNPKLYRDLVTITNWKWFGAMTYSKLPNIENLTVQYRTLQEPIKLKNFELVKKIDRSTDLKLDDISDNEMSLPVESDSVMIKVQLDRPYRGIAPGQNMVLYDGERVLGSGEISKTGSSSSFGNSSDSSSGSLSGSLSGGSPITSPNRSTSISSGN